MEKENKTDKKYSATTYKIIGNIMIILGVIGILLGIISFSAIGVVLLIFGILCIYIGKSYTVKSKNMKEHLDNIDIDTDINSKSASYQNKRHYMLDTSSKIIHEMDCDKISDIPIQNRFMTADVQNAFSEGYQTCNHCKPLIGNGSFIPSNHVTLEKEQLSLEKEQPNSDTKFLSTAEFIDQLTHSKPLKGTIARLSDREQKDNEFESEFRVAGVTFEGRQEKLAKIYEENVQSASLQWTEWKGEPAIKVICNKMDIGRIPADNVEFFIDNDVKFISEVYVDYFDKDCTPTYYAKVTVVAKDDF